MREAPTPTTKEPMTDLLTPTQTARKWGCGIATVYRRMDDGTLPYTQTDRGRYIKTTDAETTFRDPNTRPRPYAGRRRAHRKTHCKHGHKFTTENTIVTTNKNGQKQRRCKTCTREYQRRYAARRRANKHNTHN